MLSHHDGVRRAQVCLIILMRPAKKDDGLAGEQLQYGYFTLLAHNSRLHDKSVLIAQIFPSLTMRKKIMSIKKNTELNK